MELLAKALKEDSRRQIQIFYQMRSKIKEAFKEVFQAWREKRHLFTSLREFKRIFLHENIILLYFDHVMYDTIIRE